MTGPFVWYNGRERRVAREEHGGDDDDEGSAAREEDVKSDDDGWVLTRHRSRKNAMVERDQAPERWERQLMPGTKVLVRDLNSSTTIVLR